MEVRTDETDDNGGDRQRVDDAESGVADPQDGHYGANGRGMPGREGGVSRPAMEGVEPIGAVANERRIVTHPGFRPRAPECEFQLILYRIGDRETGSSERCNRLHLGQRAAEQRVQAYRGEGKQDDRRYDLGNVCELCEEVIALQLRMGEKR